MRTRTLRLTAAASAAVLALAAMLSCSTSTDAPGDPAGGPGAGAGGGLLLLPDIASVTPVESCANAGNLVTIEGSNLVDNAFLATVRIQGVTASVQQRQDGGSGTDTLIVATPSLTVPDSGLMVSVSVTTPYGTDTAAGAIRLYPGCQGPPAIAVVTPATGARSGFESITLTGTNLACLQQVQFVSTATTAPIPPTLFAQVASVESNQSITILSPVNLDPSAAPYRILAINGCGSNAASAPTFQYTGSGPGGGPALPDATQTVDLDNPLLVNSGPAAGGNRVRISGLNLSLATEILIGSTTLLTLADGDFEIDFNGGIIITSFPPSPLGPNTNVTLPISVRSDDGADPTPVGYSYTASVGGTPTFDAAQAIEAPAAGGTVFRITGTNLGNATGVLFGGAAGVPACSIQVQGAGSLSGVAPAYLTPGGPFPADVSVRVQLPAGDSAVTPTFRYYANPTLSAAVPDAVEAGTPVTLNGANFRGAGGTSFVGRIEFARTGTTTAAATLLPGQFTVVNATTITFNFPASLTVADYYDLTIWTPNAGADCDLLDLAGASYTLPRAVFLGTPPSASDVSPAFGRWDGGTTVTINGTFNLPLTRVTICGIEQAITPPQTTTAVKIRTRGLASEADPNAGIQCPVVITNTAGQSTPVPGSYTFTREPNLTSISVVTQNCATLSTTGGTPVPVVAGQLLTLTGQDFGALPAGVNQVTIGGTAAAIVSGTRTATSLQVFVPTTPTAVGPRYDVVASVVFPGAAGTADASFVAPLPLTVDYLDAPTITSLAPTSAPANAILTITGTNMRDVDGSAARVRFNNTTAAAVPGTATDTSLQVIVPDPTSVGSTPGGQAFLTVENCVGRVTRAYTYPCNTPTLDPLAVTTGIAGDVITLTGRDLVDPGSTTTTVNFGAVTAQLSGTPTATSVSVIVPPGADGARATITLTTCGGTATAVPQFTYRCPSPVAQAITPDTGKAGDTVTINGAELDGDGTAPVVQFNGVAATVVSSTPISITVVVPAQPVPPAGPVDVTVTACGNTSASTPQFTYCPRPDVTSGPDVLSGSSGATLTFTGTNLVGPSVGVPPTVTFTSGGTSVAANVVPGYTDNQVQVLAPSGLTGVATITLQTCGGTDSAPATFTFCNEPTVTSVSPETAPVGSQVTITGTNFIGVGGAAATVVKFGDVVVVPILTLATQIVVRVPAQVPPTITVVPVTVTVCASATGAGPNPFTYCASPAIDAAGLSATSGQAGDLIRITGSGFLGANGTEPTVMFGTFEAGAIVSFTDTEILATVPTGPPTGAVVAVKVTACLGTATAAQTFTFTAGRQAFEVLSISPDQGPRDGGQTVAISGNGLENVNSVTICGVAATIVSATSTAVTITTQPYNGPAPTTCEVRVGDSAGNQDVLSDAYTYEALLPDAQRFVDSVSVPVPGTEGLSALTAPNAGGTVFAIDGVNLLDVDEVQFGGQVGDPKGCQLQAAGNTRVTGVVPAYNTSGGPFPRLVDVFVSSPAGRDETPVRLPRQFTYYDNPRLTGATVYVGNSNIPRAGAGVAYPGDKIILTGTAFRPMSWSHVHRVSTEGGTVSGDLGFSIGASNDLGGANTITVFVPGGMKQGDVFDVTIHTPSGPSCTNAYSFSLIGFRVPEFACNDTVDNDADQSIDCLDPDCSGVPPCP